MVHLEHVSKGTPRGWEIVDVLQGEARNKLWKCRGRNWE